MSKKLNIIDFLGLFAFAGILASLWAIFQFVPTEKTLGVVQRIFYFHFPIAINTFIAFTIVCVSSILYLWKRDEKYDIIAHSAAEVGVVLCSLVLFTGSIWGKANWGAWWTWDPRLTTSLIMFMTYVAYMMLRAAAENNMQGARFAAVFGIVAYAAVPLVYFSINLWKDRSIHPKKIELEASMQVAKYLSLMAITCLHIYILKLRIKIGNTRYILDGLKVKLHS